MKVAAAPISWGVCEVPGWGFQLPAERVLAEMRSLGVRALEAGPEGFLEGPVTGMRVVAAFVAAGDLAPLERQARWLNEAGGDVLVMAAAGEEPGYESSPEPDEATWHALGLAQETALRSGLGFAVHPHFGTRIATSEHVERLLHVTTSGLCLDTGHLLLGGVDPLHLVERAAQRISHVHLKDVDLRLAEQVRNGNLGYHDAVSSGLYVPLGEGGGRIAEIVRTLEAAGYRGWYVLEQDLVLTHEPAPGRGPVETARRSLEFIRSL